MEKSQPPIHIPEPWTVDKIRKKKKMQRDNYHKNKMDFDTPLDIKRLTNRRSEEMKQVLEDKTDSWLNRRAEIVKLKMRFENDENLTQHLKVSIAKF